jgi:hypothetical protein
MQIPSGEGERRAQRGYVPQYDLGAKVIYEELAAGRLLWIGVADRCAGSFDDIVLGLSDRIIAYQVKSSRDPEPFSINKLLLGADNLLGRMIEARRRIAENVTNANVETVYVCDDYPRTNDELGDSGLTSAAYLRAHEAHRRSWGILEWRNSIYGSFINVIQQHSGLNDAEFGIMWRNTQFKTGGQGRAVGIDNPTSGDTKRIGQIAALLPKLVADKADRDRWLVSDLLDRLQWKDPFSLRHSHAFPIDALYESNEKTQERLSKTLAVTTSGYVSLVGSPGSGKSTLLAAGLLPTPRAHIIRYLAFVPGKGQGFGRGEAFDFLHDLVKQLKQQRLGEKIVPGSELPELRAQLQALLDEASERFRTEATKTIIVVDGLDHVSREERPQYSFLRELPLPDAVPQGVLFVLGTQRLNLEDIPPSVADQAGESERYIPVAPLTHEAVNRLAELAGIPQDVDRHEIFNRAEGHPLSTRYIIRGLLNAAGAEDRKQWLTNGPAYGGDVDGFYKSAWHDLNGNPDAQRGMGYLALVEGSISPATLDLAIGPNATTAVWEAAHHLLRIDRENNWAVFHNSFRLFLRDRTSLRYGSPDQEQVRQRYVDLAEMALQADDRDGQRWMELRYRARATQHERVAALASPERFRKQFVEGRNPEEIQEDISLSFHSAKVLRNPHLVLELILASHELSMRIEALRDDVFDAFIYSGDFGAAKAILRAANENLTAGKGFELVEALLASGEIDEAREEFEALEPIDKLLGSQEIRFQIEKDGLEQWAEQALAFREPKQILASLDRLRASQNPFGTEADLENYKATLKVFAARGHLKRNPEFSLADLVSLLEIGKSDEIIVLYLGAMSAYGAENETLTMERLQVCAQKLSDLSPVFRRELSHVANAMDHSDLALAFIEGVDAPTLDSGQLNSSDEDLRRQSRQVILHASLRSRSGLSSSAGTKPKSDLLAIYQTRLESLGRILGESLSKKMDGTNPMSELESFLDFLQRGKGQDSHDFDRWSIDRVMDEAITAMVDTAGILGKVFLQHFSETMDARLANDPGRFNRSAVRRAYAKAVFRHDRNVESAVKRMAYEPGTEQTPAGEFSEAALTAQSLVFIGMVDEARAVLKRIHQEGVGYSRPAKKDPQYLLWKDLLVRANDEDPAGRAARIRFFSRFLSGLAKTEGVGAAQRMIGTVLEEAARSDSMTAASMADVVEKYDLSTWSDTVQALALGVTKEEPLFADASAVVIGRLGIPFDTEVNTELLSDLIRCTPAHQLQSVVQRIVEVLEMDAPLDSRILALEAVIKTATDRGLNYGVEALNRWRGELPPPKSGNSPEDPFFLLRSLPEIATMLENVRGESSSYGARSAFLRIASLANYDSAMALFDKENVLNTDEQVIETMAQMAIANEKRSDAEKLLPVLRRIAGERGSWGGAWRGESKQRYFRLRRELGDEEAAFQAFDVFVDDLAAGRESCDYILPEVGTIFSLISPTIMWRDAWEMLAVHLSQFREYKHGADLSVRQDICLGGEHTLADILLRSVETTSIPLTQMARTAAIEMAPYHKGASVIGALLPRLWKRGDYFALEASQLAWECRSVDALKSSFEQMVPSMVTSNDIAIRHAGVMLAEKLNLVVAEKHNDLSPAYTLTLANRPSFQDFGPPSGMSLTSSGLYAEDIFSWTWVLENPLRMASFASGIELSNLRYRVAQLMSQNGGTTAFGPDVVTIQISRLRRLSLHTSYRKLLSSAAFQAMREVLGELVGADSIVLTMVPLIAIRSGAYSPVVSTCPPVPRPIGITSVSLPEVFASHNDRQWVDAVDDDLVRPQVEGFSVLAAIATHERSFRDRSWLTEQYFGPSIEVKSANLFEHLQHIPKLAVTDRIELRYQTVSSGAIAHPEPIMAGSIDMNELMMCPVVAAKLGWLSDPNNARHLFAGDGNLSRCYERFSVR